MEKPKHSLTGVFKRLFRRFRRDLGVQIAFFYLMFVVPVVVIGFWFGRAINVRLRADVMTTDLALARTIAQETELNLTNARYAAQELARYTNVYSEDFSAIDELRSSLVGVQSTTNPLTLLSDWWIINNREPIGLDVIPPEAFSSRDYFQQTELSGPLISNGWRSSTTWQPMVTSVMPIWNDLGKVIGVVVSNIRLDALSETLTKMTNEHGFRSKEGIQVMIVDSSRKIIAHPERSMLLRSVSQIPSSVVTDVLQGQVGNQVSEHNGGPEMLYSYAPIPGTQWGVVISRPTEVAFATARAVTRNLLIVVAVFLGVGMVFWVGLSFQVIRPMEKLAVYSQTISSNEELSESQRRELDSLARRQDQVGHLTDTLVQMEADIEARLNELATLLQTSAAVVSTLENQAVLDRILEQVERLLDVEMSAIVALDRDDGTFRTQASRGITRAQAAQLTVDPQDTDSVILQALRGRAPVQVSNVENGMISSEVRSQALQAGYKSILAIPLQTLYAPPSALLIFKAEPHKFSDREISLLTSFANHAAMAIENATLYARSDMRLQKQTRRLEALIQSLEDGLILENLDGKIDYANRRISRLIKMPSEEIVGAPVDEIVDRLLKDTEDADEIKESLRIVPATSEPQIVEFEIHHRGRKLNFRIQVFQVTDGFGVLMGRGLIFYDVTADRELDHMKSRLVSTVSHELRTPLASIKGYATTLLADDVEWDPQSQREFLEVISSETDRLSAMVTDLLDLSKIEAGSLSVHRTEIQLYEIIQFAGQRAFPPPDGRLLVELQADMPELYLDKRLIETVFRNLIENATKYGGGESTITITANVENGNLLVHVQDEGPGIPVQYQENLFDSFYSPETGSKRTNSGFGLGLTICKGFIEAHGGYIWIEPCSTGACFAFSLPIDED
ncbi:ATP-binding protein [Chloroflexota bacterium]